jgi:cytochrome c oxidase cbb3-type subunit 3
MIRWACGAFVLLLVAAQAGAQPRSGERPQWDQAALQRGRELLVEQCGFCHGSNGRGGNAGPDLTRSELVQEDENGKQLGEFLKLGRIDKGMPKFELTDAQLQDLATVLHEAIFQVANRNLYKILDVVVGDPKKGEAYFNHNCASCHSATGDLKGVGAKYEPVNLQQRMLMPRGGRGPGGPGGPRGPGAPRFTPPYQEPTALKATVKLPSGGSFVGALVRLTEFDVTLYDAETKRLHSWLRHDGVPEVVITDPLQGHVTQLQRWTDEDMHDVTAFLVTLK